MGFVLPRATVFSTSTVLDDQVKSLSASGLPELLQLLSQVEHRLTRAAEALLEEHGCTVEQWRSLTLLSDGASHAMSELAEYVMLPAPSLTRLIDRLVADNLAYRTADPRDRRRVLVRATSRGQGLQRRLASALDGERILAGAPASELAELGDLLTSLVARRP